MREYIDKDVARRIIDSERSKEQMLTMLDNVPTADVRENVKGNWKISYIPSKDAIELEYCSECGWGKMIEEKREYNFCPNCGALMSESLKVYEIGKSLVDGIQAGIKGEKE